MKKLWRARVSGPFLPRMTTSVLFMQGFGVTVGGAQGSLLALLREHTWRCSGAFPLWFWGSNHGQPPAKQMPSPAALCLSDPSYRYCSDQTTEGRVALLLTWSLGFGCSSQDWGGEEVDVSGNVGNPGYLTPLEEWPGFSHCWKVRRTRVLCSAFPQILNCFHSATWNFGHCNTSLLALTFALIPVKQPPLNQDFLVFVFWAGGWSPDREGVPEVSRVGGAVVLVFVTVLLPGEMENIWFSFVSCFLVSLVFVFACAWLLPRSAWLCCRCSEVHAACRDACASPRTMRPQPVGLWRHPQPRGRLRRPEELPWKLAHKGSGGKMHPST